MGVSTKRPYNHYGDAGNKSVSIKQVEDVSRKTSTRMSVQYRGEVSREDAAIVLWVPEQ
jgi:hypothetical protein